MATYLCHDDPDLVRHDAVVIESRPGAVLLSRTAFHPGGGGQVGDRGTIEWSGGVARVSHVEIDHLDRWWHVFDDAPTLEMSGTVAVEIDADHRWRVSSLHTTSHILNALVFAEFAGALVTGAQINGDGTGRMDFDLPDVDNQRLRGLETPVNDVIRRDLAVRTTLVDADEVAAVPGLVRSASVAPPPDADGRVRLVDIEGIDRQACGGTHLHHTGASPEIVITKVENKGRHNRRVRFAFASGDR